MRATTGWVMGEALSGESFYRLLADVLLVSHALVAAFIVLGLAAIYLGNWLSWAWVRNFWLRLLHLAAILTVVVQSWTGAICPLTDWEMQLRDLAGQERYQGSFIQHWVQAILYYDAPAWVFVLGYTLFAGLVVLSWFLVPPRRDQ